MFFGNYNNMNMFGMNGMFGMGSSFNTGNLVSQLFSGTNSIFNTGCFGGGSNFFGGISNMFGGGMSGLFGCNGSLFTNCNGSINYGAMAGWGVASVLLGIGGQIANQAIENKKAYSKETIQSDIQTFDKQIQEQVDKLGCDSASEALKFTVETKYQTDIDTATKNFVKAENSIITLDNAIKELNAQKEGLDKNAKDYNITTSDIDTKIREKEEEKAKLENSIKENGELYKAKQSAIEAKKAREAEIEKIKAEIKRLQTAKANAQKMLDDKLLNKADGNQFQRTDFETLNNLFTKDANGNVTLQQANYKASKADIRAAIKGYRTATNDKEKDEWKEKFQKLWENFDYEDRTSDLRSAYDIICG